MKKTRKGDLELREVPGNNPYQLEIVKWYENPYYGKEHLYEQIDPYTYRSKTAAPFIHVDISCFENPECCYTICFIKKGVVDFVGNRTNNLDNIQEYKDYLWLLRKGIKESINYKPKNK
jgi:hypothetical protein